MQLIEDEEQDLLCAARIQEKIRRMEEALASWTRSPKIWKDTQLRREEETMPRLKAADLKRAAVFFFFEQALALSWMVFTESSSGFRRRLLPDNSWFC